MTRGLLSLSLLLALLLLGAAEELVVRYHGTEENVTIPLEDYLGISPSYVAEYDAEKVKVLIDPKGRVAFLSRTPGFVDVETIIFMTQERFEALQQEGPQAAEAPEQIIIQEGRPVIGEAQTLLTDLNPELGALLQRVPPERLHKIESYRTGNQQVVRLNDETRIVLGFREQKPEILIEISSDETPEFPPPTPVSLPFLGMLGFILVLVLLGGALAGLSFYRYIMTAPLPYTHPDLKRQTLLTLRHMQRRLSPRSSADFVNVLKDFFAEYFELPQPFTFADLTRKIKARPLNPSLKQALLLFLHEVTSSLFGANTEHWAQVYGTFAIPEQDLGRLILRFKRIIRKL